MEQIPVILIIILIGIIIFLLLRDKIFKRNKPKSDKDEAHREASSEKKEKFIQMDDLKNDIVRIKGNIISKKDHIISKYEEIKEDKNEKVTKTKNQAFNGTIIQITSENDSDCTDGIIKAYPIGVIPPEGICINRQSAAKFVPGQITVKPYHGLDKSISSDAYYIYTDRTGQPIISLKKSFQEKNGAYFDGDRYINPILLYKISEDTSEEVAAFELRDNVAFSLGGDQWFLYKTWKNKAPPRVAIEKASGNSVASPEQAFTTNNRTRRPPMHSSSIDPSKLP